MNETLLFGLTMLVVGMGGTLLVLIFLAFVLRGLTLLFPAEKPEHRPEETKP